MSVSERREVTVINLRMPGIPERICRQFQAPSFRNLGKENSLRETLKEAFSLFEKLRDARGRRDSRCKVYRPSKNLMRVFF